MKSAQTPIFSLSSDQQRVLVRALSCTDHIPSSTFSADLVIQEDLLDRFIQLFQSGDACRSSVSSSDVVEQGGN